MTPGFLYASPHGSHCQLVQQINWLRLLRYQDIIAGIGFQGRNLVQFQAMGFGLQLKRVVSLRDSVRILHEYARFEERLSPDVESDSLGWRHWLELLEAGTG